MSIATKTKADQVLIDCFAELLPHWTREQIESSKPMRFAEAFLLMASVHYTTNRGFVLSIEAAQLLASGDGCNPWSVRLLQMAIRKIECNVTHARSPARDDRRGKREGKHD
jgi:hypothetical protein